MIKRLLIAFLSLTLLLATSAVGWYTYQWYRFLYTPMLMEDTPSYYVYEPGATLMQLAYDLHREGLLEHPRYLIWLAGVQNVTTQLKAGEYEILPHLTTPPQLLQKLVDGDVYKRYFTIIEGWNFNQILQSAQDNPHIKNQLSSTLSTDELIEALEISAYDHPEGIFYPDTYQYTHGTTDVTILRRAHQRMQSVLEESWPKRAENLPYETPYEALVAASLIEKETAVTTEKPLVAGVIANRLNQGMRLQIDPTVIYGLGEAYTGRLTRENMRHDSPHNTYRNHGLPPTPIAMPSKSSIEAALNPADTEYLYFVARGDGSHQFSRTLEEQTAAIHRYLRNN